VDVDVDTVFRGTVPVADAAPGFNQDVNVKASLYNLLLLYSSFPLLWSTHKTTLHFRSKD